MEFSSEGRESHILRIHQCGPGRGTATPTYEPRWVTNLCCDPYACGSALHPGRNRTEGRPAARAVPAVAGIHRQGRKKDSLCHHLLQCVSATAAHPVRKLTLSR